MTWYIGRPGPTAHNWIVLPEGDHVQAEAAGWEVIKLVDATELESHKRAVQEVIDNLPDGEFTDTNVLRRCLCGLGTETS